MTFERIIRSIRTRLIKWIKSIYENCIFKFCKSVESSYPKIVPNSLYRVCFISHASGGAWEIRGQEISKCRSNWCSTLNIESIDINDFDIFVFVKHVKPEWVKKIKAQEKIIVYDVVDGWHQPNDDLRLDSKDKIREHFKIKWAPWKLDGIIFANKKMWEDLSDLTPISTYIYHRFIPKLCPIKIREKVKYIGYTGEKRSLMDWEPVIRSLCASRGIKFIINPLFYRSVDIAFAARGGSYNSYLSTSYKSNVKLANCYGSGTPALFHRENSYLETDSGEVRLFTTQQELEEKLDALLPYETRLKVQRSFLSQRPKYALKNIALQYEEFFSQFMK